MNPKTLRRYFALRRCGMRPVLAMRLAIGRRKS